MCTFTVTYTKQIHVGIFKYKSTANFIREEKLYYSHITVMEAGCRIPAGQAHNTLPL